MPIADRFIHALAIVTPTTDGTLDDYGQPVAGEPIVELVSGLVQPRKVTEVMLASQAGAEIGDHVIFLAERTLGSESWIRFNPDDGDRYDIKGVRHFEYGRDAHLEVDCRRVVSTALVETS